MTTHAEYAAGLRELASWIEQHPEIALPEQDLKVYALNTKEEAAAVLRALKPCTKKYTDEFFHIKRNFGPITYDVVFYRKEVCVRRVVGVETVEARFIPAQTIPAQTVEKVEWDCGPLLDFDDEEPAAA